MIPIGTMTSIEAVIRSAGAERPQDKRMIADAVRRALGMPEQEAAAAQRTETVLTIAEAARRLARTTRTVRHYASTGQLRGLRTGRSRKLTGVPASEIDAFIARQTAGFPAEEAGA